MKRDGRTLDHATLEEFRLLALRRVREGEKPSAVVKSLGMNRTSIYRWLKAAAGRGRGERALVARPATGRPTKLTPTQAAQVFRWINGKDPRQYGLDFGLWTRQIVATLIEEKFGVHLGVTAVGRLLARLGLTPQKPLQRAYQRDPQAIERWQRETYPGNRSGCQTKRGRHLLLGRVGISGRHRARQDLGAQGQDTRHQPARTASVDLGGLGCQRQGRLLVCDLPRCTERRTVHRVAQENDEAPQ